ncbi:DUF7269 family protein [Halosimplex amylolyticum]|uniref:DUF7269 family protein n=1 Tax=Halosimplex amylolyticum TaxID=3396616 RepID=UPI003F56DE3E
MNRRTLLLALGAVAVVAGVALTLRPGLVSFDFATVLTLGIWAVALVGVGLAAFERFDGEDDATGALPRAGERPDYDVPGDDLAAAVGTVGASERDAAERDRIRRRLRTAAIDALDRFEGEPPAEAETRLAEGTWTGDPDAAALFADGDDSVHAGVEPAFDRHAERAAAAIARLGDGDESDPAGDSGRAGRIADD